MKFNGNSLHKLLDIKITYLLMKKLMVLVNLGILENGMKAIKRLI